MYPLINKPTCFKLGFDENSFSIFLIDGRILYVPLAYFPRLMNARPEQRERYELSGGGIGIHWDELNEDISVEGLLLGFGDVTRHNIEKAKVD